MEVQAISRYIRISPRKMQLLAREVHSMAPATAASMLTHLNKNGAQALKKLIESALANAKAKELPTAQLAFKHIEVVSGGAMKRFRAVSRGMAHTYKKRMSHVRVVLTDEKAVAAKDATPKTGVIKEKK